MSLNKLEDKIVDWAADRGLVPDPDPMKQHEKTVEEVFELRDAIEQKDVAEVMDAIGDIFVTLVIQCRAWGVTMEECVQGAYDEIKDRKGKLVDGIFVKEE